MTRLAVEQYIQESNQMNLPNALTIIRMILIPVFCRLFAQGNHGWALIAYIAAAFTDALDGFLARRLNQITTFGKLIDPLADKLMQLAMLFCLTSIARIHIIVVIIYLIHDIIMVIGGVFFFKNGIVVQSNVFGKIAMVLLVVSILMVYPYPPDFVVWLTRGKWLLPAGRIVLLLAVIMAFIALVNYALDYKKKLRGR
ncbi:MAG: CDP-alcohol phosphatidyltransferase family protein [Clostridia bacterium]|nr:CDP-alcohol phosphatidyltransferase family protein [Clostridia bacterium]